jgi:hypothetical protein
MMLSLCAALTAAPAALTVAVPEDTLSLAGVWSLALGGAEPPAAFGDTIRLPGTTEDQGKGPENPARERNHLTRLHPINGPAWYQRAIDIPEAWRGKRLSLLLERTKHTRLRLDEQWLGEADSLAAPQVYELGLVAPGRHTLTIGVDNSRRPPVGDPHQLTDNTQTNWNGLLGRLELLAADAVAIADLQVYPEVGARRAKVAARLVNHTGAPAAGRLHLSAVSFNTAAPQTPPPLDAQFQIAGTEGLVEAEYPLGDGAQLWDEFAPVLYRLTARLESDAGRGQATVEFGLRNFAVHNGQFTINGRPTFLRGKHDACVFPLTGYAPMDVEGWLHYLGVCREYGLNHIRCHTWCPPRAAFEAADRLGFYLQPELPNWASFGADPAHDAWCLAEGLRIIAAYGNHPSFVMFSLGNEMGGSRAAMAEVVRKLRAADPRHLYVQGSNNDFGNPQLNPGDDYWTSFRVTNHGRKWNVRGSYASVDAPLGHVQAGPADTLYDYSEAIAGLGVPVIAHEAGQFTVYPRFAETAKYTGVTRARNLDIWREKLTAAGLADQDEAFVQASGALAAIGYREEMETALRTPGFGGFQLLDLQDFPGQGTALVGILDAFMDSKGLITPAQWRQSCAPTVLLARLPRYVWTTAETLHVGVDVANYGPAALAGAVTHWQLLDAGGKILAEGSLKAADAVQGAVSSLGEIDLPLAGLPAPSRLTLHLRLAGAEVRHDYPLWLYPAQVDLAPPPGVTISHGFDAATEVALAAGGRVLLLPAPGALGNTVEGGFMTDFWCWPMFHNRPGTMGLLLDPAHPALAAFPSESHSNWQWFDIAWAARPIILDDSPPAERPLVQVIDNLDRVHKLGLVFEATVGPGRLLVCAADLTRLTDRPAPRQLLASLLAYAGSERFAPTAAWTVEQARRRVGQRNLALGATATADTSQGENPAQAAVDGDGSTRWCPIDNQPGHWLRIDLGAAHDVQTVEIDFEHEAAYAWLLEGSADGQAWVTLADQRRNTRRAAATRLSVEGRGVRYLRLTGGDMTAAGTWFSIREVRVFGH